ncbi:Ski complex subunit Rec14 [Friedmanniomyces endolithicus]|uniref:Ski complex subunit Rec14 n=1 Tax=Friedmanniomyces endolithicus TaxID=329885 RepID=A0AAN6L2L8_9PEZI|nr:Ski complex subunit Rec14 [Friedmanniomyces endolithicus]KAK0295129.1 Ski complex subunit Rec14 [Friedmanniomyces endolithicus]KAK0931290.1 Ski complex subunit Rec14 [Friedmanniomyces endolithicus]KAK1010439.1 Ski complex subunit Rec14 [Friedmanniomyces endolithicus]KAK1013900.1 Ski complex subunit Rec14 [Friedmanniomyces endolithicus]
MAPSTPRKQDQDIVPSKTEVEVLHEDICFRPLTFNIWRETHVKPDIFLLGREPLHLHPNVHFLINNSQSLVASASDGQHTISDAHRSDIYSIAVTASQVLSASGSRRIHIYSTEGQITHAERVVDEHQYPLIQILEGVHPLGCHHICTSLDGRTAASAGFNGELKLWRWSEYRHWSSAGEVVLEDKKVSEHWALALSENGQCLACTTHDGRINIYDTRIISGAGVTLNFAQFETQSSFGMSIEISADDSMIASGHQNGGIYIVEPQHRASRT